MLGSAVLFGILVAQMFRGYIALEDYRSLRALSRLRCPSCGSQFGMAASRAARDDNEKQLEKLKQEIMAAGKEACINPSFEWEAICPTCQKSILYNCIEKKIVSP